MENIFYTQGTILQCRIIAPIEAIWIPSVRDLETITLLPTLYTKYRLLLIENGSHDDI